MVVVDSSALIPLAWVGRLDLITATVDQLRTTDDVKTEVLTEGKRGTTHLRDFLEDIQIQPPPPKAEDVASLEGTEPADASVILLAEHEAEPLLANDKGLIEVARTHGVDCWWVTTLLLKCTKAGELSPSQATTVLYDLVDAGMHLHPKVYTQIQQKLRAFDE